MKKVLLLVVSLLITFPAWGVRVNSIYQAEIPVASQSAQDRAPAIQQALAEVLVKVSGSQKILENPKIKSHPPAENLVREFSYQSATPNYLLLVQFDPEAINKILEGANVPIWGTNRPLILTWMEQETPNQAPEIVDNDSMNVLGTLLKKYAKQHGLAMLLPMMDVTDMNQMAVNDIINMSTPNLLNAAKRYESDAILIARVAQSPNGFSIQAKLLMNKDEWNLKVTAPTQVDAMANLVKAIAETLSARYAVVVSNNVQSNFTMKVVHVGQQSDFVELMRYLKHLTMVADVQLVKIEGAEVVLDLNLRGSQDSLIQNLSIGQKLKPVITPDAQNAPPTYEWNH